MKKIQDTKPNTTPPDIGETFDMSAIELCLATGNLAQLQPDQRMNYLHALCQSVKLNPLTRPFQFMDLQGKLVVYATKDCADQLRARDKVNIEIIGKEEAHGCYTVTVKASVNGRSDESCGSVPLTYPDQKKEWEGGRFTYVKHPRAGQPFQGEERANAIMKAETKAKRRVTLSICGLGMPDEEDARLMAEAELEREQTETAGVPMTDSEYKAIGDTVVGLWNASAEEPDPQVAYELRERAKLLEKSAREPEPEEHKEMMAEAKEKTKAIEKPVEMLSHPSGTYESTKGESIAWRTVKVHTATPASGVNGKPLSELMDVSDIATVRSWHKYLTKYFDKQGTKKLTIKDQVLKNAIDAGLAEMEAAHTASMAATLGTLHSAEAQTKGKAPEAEQTGHGGAPERKPEAESPPSKVETNLFGTEHERSIADAWRDVRCPESLGAKALANKRLGEMPPAYIFAIQEQVIGAGKIKDDSPPEQQEFKVAHAFAHKAILGHLGHDKGRDELLAVVAAKLKIMGRGTVDTARQLFAQIVTMRLVDMPAPIKGFADMDPTQLRTLILRWDDVEQLHDALVKQQA